MAGGPATCPPCSPTQPPQGVGYALDWWYNWRSHHRGPLMPYEELVAKLEQLLIGIKAEKTDSVAALASVSVLQDESAAQAAGAKGEVGGGGAGGPAEASGPVLAFAAEVGRAAAPPLEGTLAGAGDAGAALHWARFAAAGYGTSLQGWTRGTKSAWAASRELSRLASAAAKEGAQPLAGWSSPAKGGDAGEPVVKPPGPLLKGYAKARDLLGPNVDIVSYWAGEKKSGLLPHVLAVDRCLRRAPGSDSAATCAGGGHELAQGAAAGGSVSAAATAATAAAAAAAEPASWDSRQD